MHSVSVIDIFGSFSGFDWFQNRRSRDVAVSHTVGATERMSAMSVDAATLQLGWMNMECAP